MNATSDRRPVGALLTVMPLGFFASARPVPVSAQATDAMYQDFQVAGECGFGPAGSSTEFEYYGFRNTLLQDPETERAGVHGAPTVVACVDGEAHGDLTGQDLVAPEVSLSALLEGQEAARPLGPRARKRSLLTLAELRF